VERPHSDNFPDLMYRPVTTLKRRFSLAVKSKDTLGAPGKAHKPAQRVQKRVACLRVKLMAKDALSAHARDQASEHECFATMIGDLAPEIIGQTWCTQR